MCSVQFRHIFLQQCFYKKLLLIHWWKRCNNVLELYNAFKQAGLKPCNLGKPLVSCYGPECPGHNFGATKFRRSSCSFPSAALWRCGVCREPPRVLWQCTHGVTELGVIAVNGIEWAAGRDWPCHTAAHASALQLCPWESSHLQMLQQHQRYPLALCCRWFIILGKHWGCFLVLKPQVSNSTVTFCHLPVTQQSELCSRGKTAEPILDNFAESGKAARIGTRPCTTRKYCYALEFAFHMLLSWSL